MPPRVVRHLDDVVIVLDNPKGSRDDRYNQNRFNEDDEVYPQFAVTSKGFGFYAETSITADPHNPEGEPFFRGSVRKLTDRNPYYRVTVKF